MTSQNRSLFFLIEKQFHSSAFFHVQSLCYALLGQQRHNPKKNCCTEPKGLVIANQDASMEKETGRKQDIAVWQEQKGWPTKHLTPQASDASSCTSSWQALRERSTGRSTLRIRGNESAGLPPLCGDGCLCISRRLSGENFKSGWEDQDQSLRVNTKSLLSWKAQLESTGHCHGVFHPYHIIWHGWK